MTTPTKEELLACCERVAEPAELVDFCAQNALSPLAENWARALKDGTDLRKLLPDIAALEKLLVEFRGGVIDKYL